jgi:hypothetical protein
METQLPERFSFQRRPIPVPGDLRIEWRVALITLMLGYSRAGQASLAKLHLLNDAIRSGRSETQLDLLVGARSAMLPWGFRVEPAFARATDFVVGDRLAEWTQTAGRSALKLTSSGKSAFEKLSGEDDVLLSEKQVLSRYAKAISEAAVSAVVGPERRRA